MNYPPKIDPKNETARIVEFLRSTFIMAKKDKGVIALSGGVDSTTSLLLATKALKPKNIITLHLPSRNTNPIHSEHVKLVLDQANIPIENRLTIPISAIIQKTWRIINRNTQGSKTKNAPEQSPNRKNIDQQIAQLNKLRLGNIASRARMTVLFDQAKLHNALVIGTENKSEHLLGYFTRFGDEASDLEPIVHLYKTQVIELANFLQVPSPIITKPPTAGWWSNQTDEKELGFSYEAADPILYLHFEKHLSTAEIVKSLTKDSQMKKAEAEIITKKVIKHSQLTNFKHKVPYTIIKKLE